jgi:hypothetical protein
VHASHPTTAPPAPPPPSARRIAWRIAAVAAPAVIWFGTFWLVARAASPDVPPGRCSGIGFGCTLAPRDAVEFTGFLFGVFAVPVATVVTAACLAARGPRRRWLVSGALTVVAAGALCLAVAASG